MAEKPIFVPNKPTAESLGSMTSADVLDLAIQYDSMARRGELQNGNVASAHATALLGVAAELQGKGK